MVASKDTKPNKTAFITAVLEKNPKANRKAVIDAWTKAGRSGTVSPTLVSKLRRELGLAGNLRGPGRLVGSNGSNGPDKAGSKPTKSATQTPTARGTTSPAPATTAGTIRSSKGDRSRLLDEVESGIDDLIFTLKANGGLPEVEASLRAARRLLTLSHGK